VVSIEVQALNLLVCDVSQQFTDVSDEPTVSVLRVEDGSSMSCRRVRKLLLGYSVSVNYHWATRCWQISIRLQHVDNSPICYSMSANFQ
jgi:hypothetical protein